MWDEVECKCGLGAPHMSYFREDMSVVVRNHGNSGNTLKKELFCTNMYGEELEGKYFSPKKAMAKIDELYPIGEY
ncbi:MAG: hypothetical protein GXP14_07425 [Gammaproteobacteria bacterium]|nr:hypothetical protein [Gammaproteobacteria bacterium]